MPLAAKQISFFKCQEQKILFFVKQVKFA